MKHVTYSCDLCKKDMKGSEIVSVRLPFRFVKSLYDDPHFALDLVDYEICRDCAYQLAETARELLPEDNEYKICK